MSEFAFFRFVSAKMLTPEEEQNKQEIISLTEQVLDARGLECDARIAKVSEEELKKILEEVRRLRLVKKKKKISNEKIEDEAEQRDEVMYTNWKSVIKINLSR